MGIKELSKKTKKLRNLFGSSCVRDLGLQTLTETR